MKHTKLVVLSVDALLWEDLQIARKLPGFAQGIVRSNAV